MKKAYIMRHMICLVLGLLQGSMLLSVNAALTNRVVVAGNQIDPNPLNNTSAVVSAVIPPPGLDVSVGKVVSDLAPAEGDPIVYTISATNFGPQIATSLVITDSVPAGVTFAFASSPAYDATNGLWNIGTLAVGQSTSLMVNVTVDGGTAESTITNVASLSSVAQTDLNSTNNVDEAAITVALEGFGQIGDTVWLDAGPSGGNGLPDENLMVNGINGVLLRLYRISGGTTNFVGMQTTVTAPSGERGRYLFDRLPWGNYLVEVDFSTVPGTLSIPTTVLRFPVALGPVNAFFAADFGFMAGDPTAVELTYFRADPADNGISVQWGTKLEIDTLGFEVYRAGSVDGERLAVTRNLVAAVGSEAGADYEVLDTAVLSGPTYYYWLVEVENDMDEAVYGPVAATLGLYEEGETLAVFSAERGGIYRITFESLQAAGIAAGQLDPEQISITLDGQEVAALVTAARGRMREGDYIQFYAPPELAGARVRLALKDEALRMPWANVRPEEGEGEVWQSSADEDNTLAFTTDSAYIRYMIVGFGATPLWLLDITDENFPVFLYGYKILSVGQEYGVYLSYFTDEPADVLAVDESEVLDVDSLTSE